MGLQRIAFDPRRHRIDLAHDPSATLASRAPRQPVPPAQPPVPVPERPASPGLRLPPLEALRAPPLSPGARFLPVCGWWGPWQALFPEERPGSADHLGVCVPRGWQMPPFLLCGRLVSRKPSRRARERPGAGTVSWRRASSGGTRRRAPQGLVICPLGHGNLERGFEQRPDWGRGEGPCNGRAEARAKQGSRWGDRIGCSPRQRLTVPGPPESRRPVVTAQVA